MLNKQVFTDKQGDNKESMVVQDGEESLSLRTWHVPVGSLKDCEWIGSWESRRQAKRRQGCPNVPY